MGAGVRVGAFVGVVLVVVEVHGLAWKVEGLGLPSLGFGGKLGWVWKTRRQPGDEGARVRRLGGSRWEAAMECAKDAGIYWVADADTRWQEAGLVPRHAGGAVCGFHALRLKVHGALNHTNTHTHRESRCVEKGALERMCLRVG